jgi:hypothetical protein
MRYQTRNPRQDFYAANYRISGSINAQFGFVKPFGPVANATPTTEESLQSHKPPELNRQKPGSGNP